MSRNKNRLAKAFWPFFILAGACLIVFGPFAAYKDLASAGNSGVHITVPPNVGIMLSPEVAVGFAVFVLGLMIIGKGYNRIQTEQFNENN